MHEYELYHHGVKGPKWGVRRTAAQLGHRVAKAASKAGKAAGKFASKQAVKAKKAAIASAKQHAAESKEKRYYKKLHKKKLSQMTDKEIADLTKRVKNEAALKDANYESRVQNARKFYKNVAEKPVNSFANTFGVELAKKIVGNNNGNNGNTNNTNNNNNNDSNSKNDVTFEVTSSSTSKSSSASRREKKVKRGTANTFNNPVIIRHGR